MRASSREVGLDRPAVSVVVSTYRNPLQVCLVLVALARQTVRPLEVLVADDGSPPDTIEAIGKAAQELPFPITHLWQPDEGFRLARSRNNAIHRARGEVVAFLDQDTLPHRHWLESHLGRLGRCCICSGDVLRLPPAAAARLCPESVARGEFENVYGPDDFKRLNALQRTNNWHALLRRLGLAIRDRPACRMGNAAIHREDLARVNGFDEEYVGWGQEDDDLGRRLYMAGVRPIPVINLALVSHIPHPPRRPQKWRDGANVERFLRKPASFRCRLGLDGHPHADVQVTGFAAAVQL